MMKFLLGFIALMSVTVFSETSFKVSDVELATKPLKTVSAEKVMKWTLNREIEDFGTSKTKLVHSSYHPVISSALSAFNDHRPLTLSPDIFWLLISQGVANHINLSPELRTKLVVHEGKELITVRRNHFIKGGNNNWESVFPDFIKGMKKYAKGGLIDVLDCRFSTTTPVERVAFQITIMDTYKKFFDYDCCTFCGIPSIKLEGAVEDWDKIIAKVKTLEDYKLKWWTVEIIPLLEKIRESAKGNVDVEFWKSFFKYEDMSGASSVTGWVNKFFPYTYGYRGRERVLVMNPTLSNPIIRLTTILSKNSLDLGTSDYPPAISTVPFTWNYLDQSIEMNFYAGFFGISQTEKMELKPEIGWAVAGRNAEAEKLLELTVEETLKRMKGFVVKKLDIKEADVADVVRIIADKVALGFVFFDRNMNVLSYDEDGNAIRERHAEKITAEEESVADAQKSRGVSIVDEPIAVEYDDFEDDFSDFEDEEFSDDDVFDAVNDLDYVTFKVENMPCYDVLEFLCKMAEYEFSVGCGKIILMPKYPLSEQ